ncbi:MAG: hypothetical protein KJ593_06330 [Candidatus Omnitrophica bacterium]|nr:hypothetical protein [Candidatus Omnitrophota bacterium]
MEKKLNLEEIFRKMCLIRYFEFQVVEAVKKNLVPGVVYLSVGQEAISATMSALTEGYAVFTQHRCHSTYLSYGGDIERLIDELLGRRSGCCEGRGGSPCIKDLNIPMYSHNGLIGENIPLATGYCLASGKPTVVYFGDAAAEEDYVLSSYGFAEKNKLPILYVCEDNNLSILTPIEVRRNWKIPDVTKAMGLVSESIVDDPEIIFDSIKKLTKCLPAFINIKTCRHLWHVGIGNDGSPKQDRLSEVKKKISNAKLIENEMKRYVGELWRKQLQGQ